MSAFAKQAQVPLDVIQIILKGNVVNLKFYTAYAILKILDPVNFKALLLDHYEHYFRSIELFVPSDVNRQNAALRIALSSRLSYKIHCMASTSVGTSRSEIYKLLGVKGEVVLDELLSQGVLIELNDCISDPFYNLHQSNEDMIRRMIQYNLDEFYPHDRHAGILNIVEGFSEEGLDKVRAIVRKFHADIQHIMKDPQCIGNEKFFISAVIGKFFPNKVDRGYEPNSELIDINSQERLSALAHDMRAPMKYVLSFLDNHTSEDMSATQLTQARNAAIRVDLMIDSLKNLNGHEMASRKMDILSLDSILEFASTLADDHKKKFQFSGHKEFSGYMDKDKIDRIIQNLLMNAFEAADSVVELEYLREKDSILILVSDDGPGVPQGHVDKIFERGFTFGKTHGTGLGLATVKAIAQGHEGEVWYERKDYKTIFKVRLRNIFIDSVFEEMLDPLASIESIPGLDGQEKPILFISLSDDAVSCDCRRTLEKELPSYLITDDVLQLSRARLVCTDKVDLASQAVEAGVQRVWTVPESVVSHADFVPALVRLADKEYPKHLTPSDKDTI
jgi:anti-sigma regulatory factor (Ser/Thr protein kinase)